MIRQNYAGQGIREILDQAPYEWRATGTYGVERILKNGHISNVLLIYVEKKDIKKWDEYLKSNSVQPTNILPDLKIVGVDSLPKLYAKDKNVVDISYLIEDLAKVAPRYKDTHPNVVDDLRDVA